MVSGGRAQHPGLPRLLPGARELSTFSRVGLRRSLRPRPHAALRHDLGLRAGSRCCPGRRRCSCSSGGAGGAGALARLREDPARAFLLGLEPRAALLLHAEPQRGGDVRPAGAPADRGAAGRRARAARVGERRGGGAGGDSARSRGGSARRATRSSCGRRRRWGRARAPGSGAGHRARAAGRPARGVRRRALALRSRRAPARARRRDGALHSAGRRRRARAPRPRDRRARVHARARGERRRPSSASGAASSRSFARSRRARASISRDAAAGARRAIPRGWRPSRRPGVPARGPAPPGPPRSGCRDALQGLHPCATSEATFSSETRRRAGKRLPPPARSERGVRQERVRTQAPLRRGRGRARAQRKLARLRLRSRTAGSLRRRARGAPARAARRPHPRLPLDAPARRARAGPRVARVHVPVVALLGLRAAPPRCRPGRLHPVQFRRGSGSLSPLPARRGRPRLPEGRPDRRAGLLQLLGRHDLSARGLRRRQADRRRGRSGAPGRVGERDERSPVRGGRHHRRGRQRRPARAPESARERRGPPGRRARDVADRRRRVPAGRRRRHAERGLLRARALGPARSRRAHRDDGRRDRRSLRERRRHRDPQVDRPRQARLHLRGGLAPPLRFPRPQPGVRRAPGRLHQSPGSDRAQRQGLLDQQHHPDGSPGPGLLRDRRASGT